jgi:hypothetical protein
VVTVNSLNGQVSLTAGGTDLGVAWYGVAGDIQVGFALGQGARITLIGVETV